MPYRAVRAHLRRCREAAAQGDCNTGGLADAMEQLAAALEADLTQIKGALSHIARQLEASDDAGAAAAADGEEA
jgi:hypothetical protein